MAKKKAMPPVLFVGPSPKNRQKFKYVLFRVISKNADGVPEDLVLMHDEEQPIDIEGGEEFMTGYIPALMLEKE